MNSLLLILLQLILIIILYDCLASASRCFGIPLAHRSPRLSRRRWFVGVTLFRIIARTGTGSLEVVEVEVIGPGADFWVGFAAETHRGF